MRKEYVKYGRWICCLFVIVAAIGTAFLIRSNVAYAKAKVGLNKTKVTIQEGKSVCLKLKGTKKKVKWSSNNKRVAKVSTRGKVTAVKEGNAKITAKVSNKKYVCKVKVKARPYTVNENTTEQVLPVLPATTETYQPVQPTTEKTTEQITEQTTENTGVKLQSITTITSELLIKKGTTSIQGMPLTTMLGVVMHYSDGSSRILDEFEGRTKSVQLDGVDMNVEGEYCATFTVIEGKDKASTDINVTVCNEQENDDFRYRSNGQIAYITGVKATEGDVIIPEKIGSATVIGGYLFVGNPSESKIDSLTLPKSWRWISEMISMGQSLKAIMVEKENPYWSTVDGVLFDKEQQVLYDYPSNKESESYVIPDTVISIRQTAFCDCKNLKKVTIPKSVETICAGIGYAVFQFYGNELEEIVVEDGNPHYQSIDNVLYTESDYALGELQIHEKIILLYPANKKDKTYRIEDGVTHIATDAFRGNSYIENLVIPIDDLEYCGYTPFADCDSLKAFYLEGTNTSLRISAEEFCDGSIIYVRSEEIKNQIEEELHNDYYYKTCTVSDDFNW